jgi:hypothetical protein
MPKDTNPGTQRKAVRSLFKRLGAAACVTVSVVCGLVYFHKDLPFLNLSSASPHPTTHEIPNGSILIPYDNGLCRLHALDNTTGRIRDGGVVNCVQATDQNTAVWKSLSDQARATEIRKSFRHE